MYLKSTEIPSDFSCYTL